MKPARVIVLLLLGAALTLTLGCAEERTPRPMTLEGNAGRGRAAVARLQCGACHEIPYMRSARGRLGPSLDGFAQRVYLAGKWPNNKDQLVRWLQDPPAMAPLTAMPALAVDAAMAQDIAAYLYTLD